MLEQQRALLTVPAQEAISDQQVIGLQARLDRHRSPQDTAGHGGIRRQRVDSAGKHAALPFQLPHFVLPQPRPATERVWPSQTVALIEATVGLGPVSCRACGCRDRRRTRSALARRGGDACVRVPLSVPCRARLALLIFSDTHLAAGGARVPRPRRTRVTPAPSSDSSCVPHSLSRAPRGGEDAATCEPSEHSNLFTGVILMAVINTLKRLQTLHSR
jgi:hypothetical protein